MKQTMMNGSHENKEKNMIDFVHQEKYFTEFEIKTLCVIFSYQTRFGTINLTIYPNFQCRKSLITQYNRVCKCRNNVHSVIQL